MIRCRGLVVFVALFACVLAEKLQIHYPIGMRGKCPRTWRRIQMGAFRQMQLVSSIKARIWTAVSSPTPKTNRDGAVETDARAPDAELADALIPVDMTQIPDSANAQ